MCMLSVIPAGVECTEELLDELANGCSKNQDGFGYSIVHNNGKELVTFLGMHPIAVLEQFEKDRAIHKGDAIWHSRWGTHGEETIRNVHPFRCGKDELTVMAHNGVLPMSTWPSKGEWRSDTNIFAKRFLPSWGMRLDSPKFVQHVDKFIGSNKIAILTVNPKYAKNLYLWGEELGNWSLKTGAWHSNGDFRYPHRHCAVNDFTSGWWNNEREDPDYPTWYGNQGARGTGIVVGTPNADWLPGRSVQRAASVDDYDTGSVHYAKQADGSWKPFKMNAVGQRILTEQDIIEAHGYVPVDRREAVHVDDIMVLDEACQMCDSHAFDTVNLCCASCGQPALNITDANEACPVCGSFGGYDTTWKSCSECRHCGDCRQSIAQGECQCYTPEFLRIKMGSSSGGGSWYGLE